MMQKYRIFFPETICNLFDIHEDILEEGVCGGTKERSVFFSLTNSMITVEAATNADIMKYE